MKTIKMTNQSNKNLALLTHLAGFGGYIFPFGSVVIPLIIRETKKEESKLIDKVSKEVVNFNLSYLLYTLILKVSIVPFFVGSFFQNFRTVTAHDNMNFHFNSHDFFGVVSIASILSLFTIVKVILIVQATIKTHNDKDFKYPFTIAFIK